MGLVGVQRQFDDQLDDTVGVFIQNGATKSQFCEIERNILSINSWFLKRTSLDLDVIYCLPPRKNDEGIQKHTHTDTHASWWFQIFFIFTPTW